MKTLWKLRMVLVIAALVLVAGGAVVVGAKGLVGGEGPKTSAGESQQHQNNGSEPGSTQKGAEATATKGTEPPAPVIANWSGKIVSVDCAGGTLTIAPDGAAANTTASAQMAQGTSVNVSGKSAACSALKVGWHVTMEVQQVNGQWVVLHITQDDSGQPVVVPPGEGTPTPTGK
jgi:hypothetical protein